MTERQFLFLALLGLIFLNVFFTVRSVRGTGHLHGLIACTSIVGAAISAWQRRWGPTKIEFVLAMVAGALLVPWVASWTSLLLRSLALVPVLAILVRTGVGVRRNVREAN